MRLIGRDHHVTWAAATGRIHPAGVSGEGELFNWETMVLSVDTNFLAMQLYFILTLNTPGKRDSAWIDVWSCDSSCSENLHLCFLPWEMNVAPRAPLGAVGSLLGSPPFWGPFCSLICRFSASLFFPPFPRVASKTEAPQPQAAARLCPGMCAAATGRAGASQLLCRGIRWTQETFQWETNTALGKTHGEGKQVRPHDLIQWKPGHGSALSSDNLLLNTRWCDFSSLSNG